MPNIVTTFVTVVGSEADVATFTARHLLLRAGGASFDLDTIAPVPAALAGLAASSDADLGFYALSRQPNSTMREDLARITEFAPIDAERHPLDGYGIVPRAIRSADALHAWLQVNRPDALLEGARHLRAFETTGFENEREWIECHWGTNRNTLSTDMLDDGNGSLTFSFKTAWAFPAPIFLRLAAAYPTLIFRVAAYEEEGSYALEGEYNGQRAMREVDATPDWYANLPAPSAQADDGELARMAVGR